MHSDAPAWELISPDLDAPVVAARTVPDDVRRFVSERGLARPAPGAAVVRAAGALVAWVALAGVGLLVDRWWAWLVVWALLALVLAGFNPIMHESVHYNLFAGRNSNYVVGGLAGAVLFMHAPAFRAYHLTHHAYTFTPRDSEQLPERFRSRLHLLGFSAVLGPGFVLLLWAGAVGTLLGRPPKWVGTKRMAQHVRRWSVLPVLGLVAAAALLWWDAGVVAKVWLVPAALAIVFVFPVFTIAEHYGGVGSTSLLANTRTVEGGPVGRLVWWQNNFHTAHHLVPTVPPVRLAELDSCFAERNSLRDATYPRFWARELQKLPWW